MLPRRVPAAAAALALMSLLSAACAVRRPPEENLFHFDEGGFDEPTRAKVREIRDAPSSIASLRETRVKSRREVYQFLFDNLDFAAACARALGRGAYRIERTEDGFRLDDGQGMMLDLRRVFEDSVRWVFLCVGTYQAGLLGTFQGDMLTVIHARTEERVLVTRGVVYLRLRGGSQLAAEVMPRFVQTLMQRKGGLFIEAATAVVEEASKDPEGFCERLEESKEVDLAALEKFRRALVK